MHCFYCYTTISSAELLYSGEVLTDLYRNTLCHQNNVRSICFCCFLSRFETFVRCHNLLLYSVIHSFGLFWSCLYASALSFSEFTIKTLQIRKNFTRQKTDRKRWRPNEKVTNKKLETSKHSTSPKKKKICVLRSRKNIKIEHDLIWF